MPYQRAITYGNVGTLTNLSVQPKSDGIFTAGEDIFAPNGNVYEDGFSFTEWVYTILEESEYVALLSELGLTSAKSAPLTVRTRKNDDSFGNYNSIIIRPSRLQRTYNGYRDVRFRLNWMEAL